MTDEVGQAVAVPTPARSQTLDRGLKLLELVAAAAAPLTVPDLAARSGLHRSVVYRLVRTLEDHGYVARDATDAYRLGAGLVGLTRRMSNGITDVARPALQALADDTGLVAFVVVREGDMAVTATVAEPADPGVVFVQRIGYRHPVRVGAPGIALRMLTAPATADDERMTLCRRRGWADSHGEVLPDVTSVAAPLAGLDVAAAVAVNFIGERDVDELGGRVLRAAAAIVCAT